MIITRMAGRTPVPEKESIESFAAHQATMVVFLSTGMLEELSRRLIEGGYREDTPARHRLQGHLGGREGLRLHRGHPGGDSQEGEYHENSLMIIGDAVTHSHYDRSKLYHPEFTTEFRQGTKQA